MRKLQSHGLSRIVRNVNDVRTPRGLTAPSIKSVFRVAMAWDHVYRASSFRTSTDLRGSTTDTFATGASVGEAVPLPLPPGTGPVTPNEVSVDGSGGVYANSTVVPSPGSR